MSRGGIALGAVCVLTLTIASMGAVSLLGSTERPESLSSAPETTSAPAVPIRFDDARSVQVQLVRGADRRVVLGRGGTLTETACVVGAELTSGGSIGRVDDVPVLAFHSTLPLYRDLGRGDEGRDVVAVQLELQRLGFDVAADGSFGRATASAIEAVQERIGVEDPTGRFEAAGFVWLAAPSITVSSCSVGLGDAVTPGTVFAVAAGTLERIELDAMPVSPVSGQRVLTVFGIEGVVDESLSVAAPEVLAAVSATPEARALALGDPTGTAGAVFVLAEPREAMRVPVSAVFAVVAGRGCIQVTDVGLPVEVIGSSLGAAVVQVPTGTPVPKEVRIGTGITARSY